MSERRTITGVLRCYRYARSHARGRVTLGAALADAINPLPPDELWLISAPDATSPRGTAAYRLRSGRLPACLTRDMENAEVTVTATVEPFHGTGDGAYIANLRLIAVVGERAPDPGAGT
jgi:hypothetical protein